MKMKKFISYLVIGIMALSFAGCTKGGEKTTGDDSIKINENNVSGTMKPSEGGTKTEGSKITEINLYFADDQGEYLVAEKRKIENIDEKKALEELIKGPTTKSLYGVIDKSVKVNSVTIKDKIANIDFDSSIKGKVSGSAGETLALYGVANTMILNDKLGIEKVTFSVDKEPMESLGGHIVLDEPVGSNKEIIKK